MHLELVCDLEYKTSKFVEHVGSLSKLIQLPHHTFLKCCTVLYYYHTYNGALW